MSTPDTSSTVETTPEQRDQTYERLDRRMAKEETALDLTKELARQVKGETPLGEAYVELETAANASHTGYDNLRIFEGVINEYFRQITFFIKDKYDGNLSKRTSETAAVVASTHRINPPDNAFNQRLTDILDAQIEHQVGA